MKLSEYLEKNHAEYDAEVRNMVEDVINATQFTLCGIDRETAAKREMLIRNAFKGMNFTKEEINAFAQGKVPVTIVNMPVEIEVPRNYRIYVRVPEYAEPEEVKQAAMDYIVENGLNDSDIDEQVDDCANDGRMAIEVDWDGVMYD